MTLSAHRVPPIHACNSSMRNPSGVQNDSDTRAAAMTIIGSSTIQKTVERMPSHSLYQGLTIGSRQRRRSVARAKCARSS